MPSIEELSLTVSYYAEGLSSRGQRIDHWTGQDGGQ